MPFPANSASVGRRASRCVLIAAGLLLAGCGGDRKSPPVTADDLFSPREMRIHPIFTQVADLDGVGKPDGIEAQLEFDDQFGDPTKASGQVLFELFDYRRQPPFTGRRVTGPWVASLATPAEQRDKWNKTLRTYRFALAFPAIVPSQDYVLTATFERTGGGRFPIAKLVMAGHKGEKTGADGKGSLGF